MDSAQFQEHTAELMDKLRTLPPDVRDALRPLLEKTIERHRRRKELITEALQALSDLRLHMKYLLFDLEATRRENAELKRRLDHS